MKFNTFIILLLVFLQVFLVQGCKTIFVNDPEKKAMKRKEQSDKAFEKNYSKIKKAHFKNQTRETRKRMKKSKKAARKMNKPKERTSKKDCI